jgi:hypothetical protein
MTVRWIIAVGVRQDHGSGEDVPLVFCAGLHDHDFQTREVAVAIKLTLIFAVLATFPQLGAAQPATQPAETPPDRVIRVQKGAPVQVLGFTDDGKTVYLYARVNRVNVWRVLAYHWPEAAGGLVALLTLRWIVRVARRPQVPGEEHCRCCNYLLKGLISDRCPECGTYLTARNRLAGRRRWPRVLAALLFLMIGTGGYFWAGARLPRQGSVSAWFDWTSMSLAEWAEVGKRTWITRHVTSDDVVLLADVEQGQVRRTLCRIQAVQDDSLFGAALLSADRQCLFCRTSAGFNAGVVQVELASGKVVRQYEGKRGKWGKLSVSAKGPARTLFSEVSMVEDASHILISLDIQGGRQLSEISLGVFAGVGVLTSAGHDFAVIMDPVAGEQIATDVCILDPALGQTVKSFRAPGYVCGCDDGTLYLALGKEDSLDVEIWDIWTGKRTNSVKVGQVERGVPTVTSGILLVRPIPRDPRKHLAVNLRTGARRSWVVAGVLPRCESVTASPDGRRVLMTVDDPVRPPKGEVRIYELSEK